jgi:uncharacterized membrane protein
VRSLWSATRDRLTASVFPVPALVALVAVGAGVVLSENSDAVDSGIGTSLWPSGASVATDVLTLLAGASLTVLSLTMSMTAVALQLASQQFSPRLLRTFMEGPEVRVVVSVFVALFVYCLAVLRGIDQADERGPQVAMFVAFVLAMLAVVALVWFIGHIVRLMRVDVMMRNAVARAGATHADLRRYASVHAGRPQPTADARPLVATTAGFVDMVDVDAAAAWTREHGATVVVDVRAGDHLLEGEPTGFVWGTEAAAPQIVRITPERSPHQDLALTLRQLTDIAIKALSPAVNDPTTAAHAVTHASRVLVEVAQRPLSPMVVTDGDRTSVWAATHGTLELLDGVTAQIRRYGSGEPAILVALLHLLHGVAHRTGDPHVHAWVDDEIGRIVAAAERHVDEPYDVDKVRRAAARPRHLSGT